MIGVDAPVITYGTLLLATIDWCADTTALENPPTSMSTLSWVINWETAVIPPSLVEASSPRMTWIGIFLPRELTYTPPFALISLAASCADCHIPFPVVLEGPVIDATMPTFRAWVGEAACWVQPAKNAERMSIPARASIGRCFIENHCYAIA